MENKEVLFNIAKEHNLFWSYSKDITYKNMLDEILIEKILAYGDIGALILLFKTYPYDTLYKVWGKELIPDSRFKPANYFLAKFFFNTNINNIKIETRMNKIIKLSKAKRG